LVNLEATLKENDNVKVIVDDKRTQIAAHHSATHLLHKALKNILGEHVNQAGSLVEAQRLRFDFSHPKALSSEELTNISQQVNQAIAKSMDVNTQVMNVEEAKKSGAMALFGEKYGDDVRVVSMEDFSVELCGGTHVSNTAKIGSFFISKESGVSAGVRRIEAVCASAATRYANDFMKTHEQLADMLKNKDPLQGVKKLKDTITELKSEISALEKSGQAELPSLMIEDTKVVIGHIDAGDIKNIIDDLKNAHEKVCVMLFQTKGGKILIAAGSKNTPLKAGAWIKAIAPIVGGGGGGRDDFAQAGGKNPAGLEEALTKSLEFAKEALN